MNRIEKEVNRIEKELNRIEKEGLITSNRKSEAADSKSADSIVKDSKRR